ncbi:N-acetylmuramoyl-L-alanine amidase [Neobacillus sp. WH10]|uniref:N-acetylmuramoyl-L-alanine amidase n=1 Tax=Neobacillus sp. WH10 TaxID=3047873 RepID=UPI0024C201D9|nr:N-acetylmuramoyl-L-alanine amidase [Neobacillus sp. WH10]WHY76976.1 N-acetylmuramoyl-L-alanine amidase [Neobacillus sp. WH10]
MNIIQRLIPASNTRTRPGLKLVPKYITIHETDNTSRGADAEAHARLQERGNDRTASWHITVDENKIIQSIPFEEVAWAAGDGRNGPGNRTSIHIEMCVNADGNYEQTASNTVEVVQYLMSRFKISSDRIVPHKYWSGKNCPRNLLPRWENFIKRCQDINDGWVKNDSQWSFYKNTSKQTGWIKTQGKYYYLDANGIMQTGWVKVKGIWYYLSSDGAMQSGWVTVDNKWYYLNDDGAMRTGWVTIDTKRYYLNDDGAMRTGWVKIDRKWYFLAQDGVMKTGWFKNQSKWYYLNPNGEMAIGWIQVDGKSYYLDSEGVMVTGIQTIDGKEYFIGNDGALIVEKPQNKEDKGNVEVRKTTAIERTWKDEDRNTTAAEDAGKDLGGKNM